MADIKYIVECDATGALKSIKELDTTIGNAAGQAKTGDKAFGGLFGQITAGTIAANLTMKAVGGLTGAVRDCIEGAIESEKTEKDLEAALSLTGRTVEGNIQHYLDFAQAQMQVTTYEDDEIKKTQALLLQLTDLDQKGIDRATKGAMGLASTLGISLEAATTKVTLAMKGQETGLSRVGIRVDENLTKEQKQASMLDQLDRLYGRSTAEVGTFGGSLKQLNNTWGEAKEAVGGALTKSEGARDLIQTINRIIARATPDIEAYAQQLASFISTVAKVIEAGLNAMDRLKEKIGGLRSNLSEEEKAWNTLNQAMGGYSTIAEDIVSVMKAQGASEKEQKQALDTLMKAWDDFGNHSGDTLKAILAGNYGKKIADAFKAVGGANIDMVEKFVKAKGPINEVGTGLNKDADAAKAAAKEKKELAKAAQEILNKYNPLKAAMAAVIKEEQELTKARKAGAISEADYRVGMDLCEKSLRAFGDTITTAVIPKAKNMQDVFAKAVSKMQQGPAFITRSWTQNATKWIQTNQQTLQKITGMTTTVVGQIDAIIQQSTTNRMLLLDQEYQHRLDLINNSKMNEEEKQKAITALEAEYSMKRRAEEVKAAKARKVVAIMTAIINTAEGVTKAWAQGGALFGPILAAIVAAAGAVQIALIKSQPIGAAKGAIFKKKALLMSQATGQEYEVAEGGEAEIVSSPRQLRQAIMGEGMAATTSQSIIIENHIYIDGQEMKSFISKTIRDLSRSELLKIHPRAVRAY